jgi:hypothetical protein
VALDRILNLARCAADDELPEWSGPRIASSNWRIRSKLLL